MFKKLNINLIKITIIWFTLINLSVSEKIRFRCDEYELSSTDAHEPDAAYCTVTDFYVNYTTQVDCDVYFMDRKNVRVVKFYNSHMMYIPTGLFRYFNEIRDFDISKSFVIDIQRNTFEGAKKLVYLTMSYNNITTLSASIFMEAPSLFVIDLSHNQISSIDRYTFADARQLSRLQLNHNKIKSLQKDVFKDLQSLDQLLLNDNEIDVIEKSLFATNYHLNKINLNNNRIKIFDTNIFSKLKYLEILQIANNQLTTLNTTFANQLKSLNISGNQLEILQIDNNCLSLSAENNRISTINIPIAINKNTNLLIKNLYLSKNNLTNIENITKLGNLENLDISFNNVGKINIDTFINLKKLITLDLAQTNVSNLDFGTFASQTEMKTLDLSYNNLNELNVIIFTPYMNKLEKFFVDGNNLTELAPLQLYFPALRVLGISNNNFNCTFLAQFLRQLDVLKVKLNIDPSDDGQPLNSTTHISGIACSNDKKEKLNSNIASPLAAVHHLNYLNKIQNLDVDNRDKLAYLYKHLNDNSNKNLMKTHVELLESNLKTTKLLLAVVCIGAFVFVAVKFIGAFVQHRNHLLDNRLTEQSRSTTTMNTLLQSGLDRI